MTKKPLGVASSIASRTRPAASHIHHSTRAIIRWHISLASLCVALNAQAPATLTGLAVLPADTFAEGPPSGAWLRADALERPQFASQPVQGISALARIGGDEWWALSDNGFGTKANSADYLLRIYRLHVKWGSRNQAGDVTVRSFIQLSDPDRKLPFPIERESSGERWLTGADLDPESFVRSDDGTFWIGDEFGPFLVHVDAAGRVLAAPYEAPHVRSPDHPQLPRSGGGAAAAATARRSRGFEGLARYGEQLYAVLEAGSAATGDADAAVIFEFDLETRRFTGQRWHLPLSSADHALTEFVSLDLLGPECNARFLAIERDGGHGRSAQLKQVREVALAGNALTSSVVVDLLRLSGGFTFPFITPEAVWPAARHELVLANDNNYPAGGGRSEYERDPTEFIRLQLATPLCAR